jgi:hypothetical protein
MPEIESSFSYFSGQDIVVYAKIMIFIQIPCLIQFLFIFLQHYHGKKETETLIDFKLQKWGIRQNKPLSLIWKCPGARLSAGADIMSAPLSPAQDLSSRLNRIRKTRKENNI